MKNNIYVSYLVSPLDYIEIQAIKDKIINIEFTEEKRFEDNTNDIIDLAKKQLIEYFKGERMKFDLPLHIAGTKFQERVWLELVKIPYGQTLSYGDIAKNIDNPKASRAVGNANNKNKISIVIPCHRVIGSNGKLVGFGGGVWRKEWLLEHENKHHK
jgi:O-6-methylguanine DNA methyltransferase